jgi:hypothetical protein
LVVLASIMTAAQHIASSEVAANGLRRLRIRRAAVLVPTPRATPLATATVIVLLASAVLLHTHPSDVDGVVAWASTNVHNLANHPIAAMIVSAFVVQGSLFPSLLIVGVGLAVLERRIGALRTLVVAFSGQVIASLLTEYGADLGAQLHLLTESSAERPDVGVSYVMYSVLAGSVLLLTGRARVIGLAVLSADVLAALVITRDMTTAGHVLSVAIGAATMAALTSRLGEDKCRGRTVILPKS